jgi:hypothetical protein
MSMTRRRRTPDHLRIPLLAGWLFADLFVVLFIISLASQPPAVTHKPPHPTVSATPSSSPSPSPSPSPTHSQQSVLQRTPIDINVPVSQSELQQLDADPADDGNLLSGLKSQIANDHLAGEKAGFVLLLVPGPDVGPAEATAKAIVSSLPSQDSGTFGSTAGEGYWGGNVSYVQFQIFFLV